MSGLLSASVSRCWKWGLVKRLSNFVSHGDNASFHLAFSLSKWSEMKVAQSCPTLCNPVGYRVHGILHTNQNNWPKETLKKCPIEVIQSTTRVWLSLWARLYVDPQVPYSSPPNKLVSLLSVLVGILLCKGEGPGPLSLTTGLAARIQCSATSASDRGTETQLQAAAGWGHPRSKGRNGWV